MKSMIELISFEPPMWALIAGTIFLIANAWVAWCFFRAKPEEGLFKEMPLCHYLMDGMTLQKGDTVCIDGEIHIICEKEAEVLNGGIGCHHVTVIKLAS